MLGTSTMHLDRRLFAGLCCAGSLATQQANAQPAPAAAEPAPAATPAAAATSPDALETPYSEPPTAPPASVPPAAPSRHKIDLAVPPKPDTRPTLPIRARRKLALTGELGWNGLAGFGPILTYHVHPRVSLDLGVGFSLLGPKVGLRGRYNFLTTPFTPFVGVGFNYADGFGQFTTDPSDDPKGDPNREPVTIEQGHAYLVQSVVGFDFIHRHGFTLVGTLGYAWLLNNDNYRVLAGTLTRDEKRGFNFAFKGGLVLGLAMGYAFQ